MVAAVRSGIPMREVARRWKVSLLTVQRWFGRAKGKRLDRVRWSDQASGHSKAPNRVAHETENLILKVRKELRETSALGEFGDVSIHLELVRRGITALPCVRTIGRVLVRRGALDARKRVRREPPPPGWYLADLVSQTAELDSFDTVVGLVIRGGTDVQVLNGISLHGGLPASWPRQSITARIATNLILSHWRALGLPAYAQFDNDTIFQGPHQHSDVIGRLMRVCLSLQVTPVFAPPREPGFQAAIESFNGQWQAKVWSRFQHASLVDLQHKSDQYIAARRHRGALRIDRAPGRSAFPQSWVQDLQIHPSGRIIFIRRTTDRGSVSFLGRTFSVDPLWLHRLVRAEVLLDQHLIRFYALRRSAPASQPLLAQTQYRLPRRAFEE